MRDTVIISGDKLNEKKLGENTSSFEFKVINESEFTTEAIEENIEYIIKLDKGIKISAEQLKTLRENADISSVTTGVYEKKDVFAFVRKIIYMIASGADIESDCSGAIIFSKHNTVLTEKAVKYNITRLLFLAVDSKIPVKRTVLHSSGKRKLSVRSVRDYFAVFLSSKILKYIFSSVIAFIIDYTLLLLLNSALPFAPLETGALVAWCVSSLVNFTVNRKFVFESISPIKTALVEYYSLAAVVFVLKTYVLIEFLTRVLSVPLAIAKPAGEAIFFILNYFVQKLIIFGKQSRK